MPQYIGIILLFCMYISIMVRLKTKVRSEQYIECLNSMGASILNSTSTWGEGIIVEPPIKDTPIKNTMEITSEQRTRFNVPNGDFPIVLIIYS